jgi:hypothetical protein
LLGIYLVFLLLVGNTRRSAGPMKNFNPTVNKKSTKKEKKK